VVLEIRDSLRLQGRVQIDTEIEFPLTRSLRRLFGGDWNSGTACAVSENKD
jgi:hypothetical protein